MKNLSNILKRHRTGITVGLCLFFFSLATPHKTQAQCSICTRTAQQLGERPAKALNKGILYLAFAPLAIVGFIGFRWYKSNEVEVKNND